MVNVDVVEKKLWMEGHVRIVGSMVGSVAREDILVLYCSS